VSDVVANGAARRARPVLERINEGEEPFAFQREHQMRERRPLQLLGKKWPFARRFPVNYDRPAGRERKTGAGPSTLERFAGDDGYPRQLSTQRTSYISNRCRQQNFMSESNQCLRQAFEQRYISADENHSCHYGVSLSQPDVEQIPDPPR
jgi:hypothetical protein